MLSTNKAPSSTTPPSGGLRISLSPGGGRLTFTVGYVFGIDYFENDSLRPYDVQSHRIDLRASWRFFPKTALYVDVKEGIFLYPHPAASDPHPDSYSLR